MNRWYMYRKYTSAKAVKPISRDRTGRLLSIAVKRPRWSMSVNMRTCRNVAPPRQLRPSVWKSICNRRSSLVFAVITIANSKNEDMHICIMNQSTRQKLTIQHQYRSYSTINTAQLQTDNETT